MSCEALADFPGEELEVVLCELVVEKGLEEIEEELVKELAQGLEEEEQKVLWGEEALERSHAKIWGKMKLYVKRWRRSNVKDKNEGFVMFGS